MCAHVYVPVSQRRISGVLLYYSWPYFFDTGSLTELGTLCLLVCFAFLLFFSSDWPGSLQDLSVCLHPSAPPLGIKGVQGHCWILYGFCGYKLRPSCYASNTLTNSAKFLARIWDKHSRVPYIRWAYGQRSHTSLSSSLS